MSINKRIEERLECAIQIAKDNDDPEEYIEGLEDARKIAREELEEELQKGGVDIA